MEGPPPQVGVGSHRLPAKVVGQPQQVEVQHPPPQEVLLTSPQATGEQAMAPGPAGIRSYFLGPGTAWRLQFEDVVAQVLQEN